MPCLTVSLAADQLPCTQPPTIWWWGSPPPDWTPRRCRPLDAPDQPVCEPDDDQDQAA